MNGKEFGEWMDAAGMSLDAASTYFGVSTGTIYKWRSTPGVPDSRVDWVRARIAEYQKAAAIELPDRITLEVPSGQFDDWNRAALVAGKILRDWAIDVLNEAAAAAEADDSTGYEAIPDPAGLRFLRAAEPEGPEYGGTADK